MAHLPELDAAARRELLVLARVTLELYLTSRPRLPYAPLCPVLEEPRGAFVSLHRSETLRGCIGQILPDGPLFETVRHCVVSAAADDPRFPAVSADELPELEIEISVLSVPRRIEGADEVEVGAHGLLVSRGRYRGVLLPQVAADQGWDRDTFLAYTCRKAGLPPDAWLDPATELEVFTAEVFSDGASS